MHWCDSPIADGTAPNVQRFYHESTEYRGARESVRRIANRETHHKVCSTRERSASPLHWVSRIFKRCSSHRVSPLENGDLRSTDYVAGKRSMRNRLTEAPVRCLVLSSSPSLHRAASSPHIRNGPGEPNLLGRSGAGWGLARRLYSQP